ncbi:DUF1517 domain-containing protein [Microcoleus vaginatus PCC 9802]|uniref:DUF1517 domain-containing protein n=1 Tax=Microcoleus vaginatus TaxID=119532 RepID=UPI00020D1243|nr:hypothetical protein MicvaDRAFT_2604 [Microcoleus vaginatus FGP-2]UNU18180.1 DUF1517 domain-containing protein [Microcoleus vaginatus PCC 9802]
MLKNQLLCCTAIAFLLAAEVTVNLTPGSGGKWLHINREAFARSSGGSSGGRSSSSSSSSSSSRSSSTSPSRSSSSSSSSNSSSGTSSSPSSPSRNSSSGTSSSSIPSRPSTSGNTGGRVRSGSFEKAASPAPVAVPNPPIPQQYGNNRTVIIQRRTYNSAPSYAVPYNAGNSQPNTGYNPEPAVNPTPITTDNSGDRQLVAPSSDNPGNSQPNTDYNQQPVINPAPIPTENTSDNAPSSPSSEDWKLFWFWLFFSGGGVALIAYCIYYYRPQSGYQNKKHIFAVSKLQVAMLVGSCPVVQSQLTELTLNSDLKSATDRAEFLQECVLVVLRSCDNWTHVCGNSQIFASREEAEQIFNQLSIQERSKLSLETLTLINSDIRYRPSVSAGNRGSGEYIVVTFLIGSEDVRPLFGDIRDSGKFKIALEKTAATPAENLLIFELIWSPQEETDSLTGDELLSSYADLIQVG